MTDGYHFEGQTMGDLVDAVLAIDNAADAIHFYDAYRAYLRTARDSGVRTAAGADAVARSNIGWCFGEGMSVERRRMWGECTGASHPVFGAMDPGPTPEQALEAGRRMGEASRADD